MKTLILFAMVLMAQTSFAFDELHMSENFQPSWFGAKLPGGIREIKDLASVRKTARALNDWRIDDGGCEGPRAPFRMTSGSFGQGGQWLQVIRVPQCEPEFSFTTFFAIRPPMSKKWYAVMGSNSEIAGNKVLSIQEGTSARRAQKLVLMGTYGTDGGGTGVVVSQIFLDQTGFGEGEVTVTGFQNIHLRDFPVQTEE